MSMGRYIDHFQKRNGEWRFYHRVTIIEANFELSESEAAAQMCAQMRASYGPAQPTARNRTDVSYQRPLRPRQPPRSQAAE
jgi:hypothetical protein